MRRLVLLLAAAFALGCAERSDRAADGGSEAVILMLCVSSSPASPLPAVPFQSDAVDDARCFEGYPGCNVWRRSVRGGREIMRRVRDEDAIEAERACRAIPALTSPAEQGRTWSRGSAAEVSRALGSRRARRG